MKTTLRIFGALCLAAILSGCTTYIKPTAFVHQIKSADRIVLTDDSFSEPLGFPGLTNPPPQLPIVITSWDAQKIIYDISWLREPVDDDGMGSSATLYVWHLNFYRGDKLLGRAGTCQDLMEIGDMEYHTPLSLRKILASYVDKARSDWAP